MCAAFPVLPASHLLAGACGWCSCRPPPETCPEDCPDKADIDLESQLDLNSTDGGQTFEVTFTNSQFQKCKDCEEDISYLSVLYCGPDGQPGTGVKIENANIGSSATLDSVPCGSTINVVFHDGSCKDVGNDQKPKNIAIDGCTNATLGDFKGLGSGDDSGGCGAYSYPLTCPS